MTELRDYQVRAISAARTSIERGTNSIVLVSPTGSGKTTLGAEIARSHISFGGSVLWLAHRKELVDQAADTLERCGLTVGCVAASSRRRPNPYAKCQVASIQTLLARASRPEASLLIFDEVHHAASDEYSKLVRCYPDALRIGLTATPERADGRGLGDLFDELQIVTTIRELTDNGYLCPLDILDPGRFLSAGQIAQKPVDAYLEHARGMKTVVFAPHLKAAREYESQFKAAGIMCSVVDGTMSFGAREAALRGHDDGAVLINVAVLTEGWDSPSTSCCILARGCGSAGLYIQIVGRVLRPFPGKERALLIDLRGVCRNPLIGRPDAEREYALEGIAIKDKHAPVAGSFCKVCGALVDESVFLCGECGTARPEQEVPEVVGLKLRAYERIRKDPPEDRARRLAKWTRESMAKGHKPGAAFYKYKAVYNEKPSRDILRAANDLLKGVG